MEPRAPQADWYCEIPLRGAAADLEALNQRLDRERRAPGTEKNLPVAYIPADEVPQEGNLPANPDVVVVAGG